MLNKKDFHSMATVCMAVIVVLVLVMCLFLSSCGKPASESSPESVTDDSSSSPVSSPVAPESDAVEENTTTESTEPITSQSANKNNDIVSSPSNPWPSEPPVTNTNKLVGRWDSIDEERVGYFEFTTDGRMIHANLAIDVDNPILFEYYYRIIDGNTIHVLPPNSGESPIDMTYTLSDGDNMLAIIDDGVSMSFKRAQ